MKPKLLKIGIALVVVGYLALCFGARFAYPKLLFPAVRDSRLPRSEGAETTFASHGTLVFWIPPRDPSARVVVMFHGNGETILNDAKVAIDLHAQYGTGALCVEYRGYGATFDGQTPTEASIFEDGEAGITFLATKGIGADRIVLWGYSLGSSVAAEMAARGHGSRLVLLAPFTSVVDMGYHFAPILPMSLIVKDRLDTYGRADRIHAPTLVVHGEDDEIVPFSQGEKVASKIPGAVFHRIPGGHHTNILSDPVARAAMIQFVIAP